VWELIGANPVDRCKPGSNYHLLIDATGILLAVGLSANTHASQLLQQLVDAVPAVIGPRGRLGRPRRRPAKLHADKGYDFPGCPRLLRRGGIIPRIARRGSSQRLGRHRWKVERPLAWLLPTGGSHSAMSGTRTHRFRVQPDCERIATLDQSTATAIRWWRQQQATEPRLCAALVAVCTRTSIPNTDPSR
jgi:hypothetical protein